MGQKTNPIGLRLGYIKDWESKWFSSKNFAELLQEDLTIRRYTYKRLEHGGVDRVEILRAPKKVTVNIHTARPGIVIGRKGTEVDKLKEELHLLTGKEITINILEVKRPELSARLAAESIARQLEGRISFRRAMKKAIASSIKMGAVGIKITCKGRLAGAEIARTEKYKEGKIPLHTLRADIDYATATAHTTYGCIGVKVWICKGEVLGRDEKEGETKAGSEREAQARDTRSREARRLRKRPRPSEGK